MLPTDLNGTTTPCSPRPAKKRPTSVINASDTDPKAKRYKMEDLTKQEAEYVEREKIAQSDSLKLTNAKSIKKARGQSSQDADILVAKYEEEIRDLRAQMAGLKAQMHHLKAQIPIKDSDKELQVMDVIAKQYIERGLENNGPTEEDVTSRFSVLHFAIVDLASDELKGRPFHKPTKTDHKNLFARLTATEKDYKAYLASSNGFKTHFFEGVIWTKLIDRLLSSPLSAFLDLKEKAIKEQVYGIVPRPTSTVIQISDRHICVVHSGASPQKFHKWRADTAHFLEDAFGPRTTWSLGGSSRIQLVEELVELLSRYSVSGAGNMGRLTSLVENIVEKTVWLACAMAKSTAYWECSMPTCPQTKLPHGFVYNKEVIDAPRKLQGGRRDVVDLIFRPSLVMNLNGSGEQYDTRIVVKKASALVYSKKPKNADPSYMEE